MKSLFTKNTDAKPIKVMNVMTAEYQVFMNGYDLATNLISAIIMSTEDSRKLLDLDYRDKIREEAKIEYIVTKQVVKKVYSPAYDMIAFESQDQEVISS